MMSLVGGRRVLIVDDQEPILRSLCRCLARKAQTECALNAEDALRMIVGSQFDVVVTDFEMAPGENGIWLLERVRAHDARIRRILTSGRAGNLFAPHIQSGLVHAFVQKPSTGNAVMAAIEATISRG